MSSNPHQDGVEETLRHEAGHDAYQRLESAGLGAALAEQWKAAPWFVSSMAIHLVIFMVLLVITPTTTATTVTTVPVEVITMEEQEQLDETPPEELPEASVIEERNDPQTQSNMASDFQFDDVAPQVVEVESVQDDTPMMMASEGGFDAGEGGGGGGAVIGVAASVGSGSGSSRGGIATRVTQKVNNINKFTEGVSGANNVSPSTRLGLEWLKAHQRNDGMWGNHCEHCSDRPGGQVNDENHNTACTAFACLAFMGYGSSPKSGQYQTQVRKGIDALVKQQNRQKTGIVSPAGNRQDSNYVHGIATMALSEAYWMSRDSRYKAPAQRAADYLVQIQNPDGGWDYAPKNEKRSDTSVAGWCIMGLKSAKTAGLKVPDDTMARARHYLENVAYRAPNDKEKAAGMAYSVEAGKPQTRGPWTMTAVGLTCLQFLEVPRENPKVKALGEATVAAIPKTYQPGQRLNFYGQYYAALGLFQFGAARELRDRPDGRPFADAWRVANRHIINTVIPSQVKTGSVREKKGSWDPAFEGSHSALGGRVGLTAVGSLIMEVYYRFDLVDQGGKKG